jgi:WD40 repeat protein
VRAWDTRSQAKAPALHITGYVYFPTSMAVHPGGTYLATGCKGFDSVGCEVKVWDVRKATAPCAELKGHSHDVTAVRYSPDGALLFSASKDGSVYAWGADTATYPRVAASPASVGHNFTSMAVLPSSGSAEVALALGAFDGSLSYYRYDGAARTLEALHSTATYGAAAGEA